MSSTTKAYGATGAGPTLATVDSGDAASIKYGRDDLLVSASSASVPIPTATGTDFSYRKYVVLYVVSGGGSTSLLNRKLKLASSLATGLSLWWAALTTYHQNTGVQGASNGDYPADSGSNGATPANQADTTWAAVTTSNQTYDSSTVAATNSTANGKYVALVLGVDNTYAGGAGAASLPNLTVTYDEQ